MKAARNLGKNMKDALAFALRVNGWQSYQTKNRPTVEAILKLQQRKLVEINENKQFRATNRGKRAATLIK